MAELNERDRQNNNPALAAAIRAWRDWPDDVDEKLAVAAAREMARPIRDLYKRWDVHNRALSPQARAILDALAPLIYSTEELKPAGDETPSPLLKQAESICALIRTHRAVDNEFDGFLCAADGCDWKDRDVRNHGGHVADIVMELTTSRVRSAPMPQSPFASNG